MWIYMYARLFKMGYVENLGLIVVLVIGIGTLCIHYTVIVYWIPVWTTRRWFQYSRPLISVCSVHEDT